MANLVIVESPAKASTIKGYLGANYKVVASKGHVRDLPKSSMGVDLDNNFEPHYINIRGKGDLLNELKKEAKTVGKIYLATDPDREGEAISWHLATALGIDVNSACRVTFNEITKGAVKDAIKAPRAIDMNLVNAQQTRRILDRIVGYKISPFLWKNIKGRLSAGRVQSVATKIIAEREAEIKAFVPVEYYTITAEFLAQDKNSFSAKYYNTKTKKHRVADKAAADAVLAEIDGGIFLVKSVKNSQKTRTPMPPFTTSTMQQEASKRLGFQSSKIMKLAQELYEGVNMGAQGVHGLITYMRTDSLRVSTVAQQAALAYIGKEYGDKYLPKNPRQFKTKSGAQDAHEAIRPANVELTPKDAKKFLSNDQYKLYKLIWDRFMASQMASAVINSSVIDIECNGHNFKASCDTVKFAGYMALYETDAEINEDSAHVLPSLPELKEGEAVAVKCVVSEQKFTEAPPRYTEASLIKCLEENGIGRPSTYAPTLSTIIARDYVRFEGKALIPTPLGELTTKLMSESFPEIIDYEFTALMEKKLDGIESGDTTMLKVLDDFYRDFKVQLERAEKSVSHASPASLVEESEYECEKCGSKMVYKNGRFGRFLACSNYPQCRTTQTVDKNGKPVVKEAREARKAEFVCESCGGEVYIKSGRFGDFYACSNYPRCKFTKPVTHKIGVPCPKCGAEVVERKVRSSVQYSCEGYPKCNFQSWDRPVNEKCPLCSNTLYYKKTRKALVCKTKGCEFTKPYKLNEDE